MYHKALVPERFQFQSIFFMSFNAANIECSDEKMKSGTILQGTFVVMVTLSSIR